MEHPYTRIFARVDLDALVFNLQSMRSHIPAGTQMAAVVKADGYGHGAPPVCAAADPFVSFFCVASAEEALHLKMHGVEKPILILGPLPEGADRVCGALLRYGIRPSVFTEAQAETVSRAAQALSAEQGEAAEYPVHIPVDTGMHRIGLTPDPAGASLVRKIAAMPGIRVEGLFTHLYRADERDLTSAETQVEQFGKFRDLLAAEGIRPALCHVSNSAGIMEGLGTAYDLVRCGITMYGIYPSEEVERTKLPLKPVMSLYSTVTYVKEIHAGDEVSYGGTFRADRTLRVATIPVGYGDGYPRQLSGKGSVLIQGRRAPILGRVCMDQMMVDVSDIPETAVGSRVTLFGRDGAEEITVEEPGRLSGRFPYEFVCDIGRRVPRVYFRDGRVIGTKDWFTDRYEDFLQ